MARAGPAEGAQRSVRRADAAADRTLHGRGPPGGGPRSGQVEAGYLGAGAGPEASDAGGWSEGGGALAGDEEAATAALRRAESLAAEIDAGPESELGAALTVARDRLAARLRS